MAERLSAADTSPAEIPTAKRSGWRRGSHSGTASSTLSRIARARRSTSRWAQLAWRLVRENDGLVNVWQAHNLAYTPTSISSLDTFIYGIGGEICRSFYGVPLLRWQGANPDDVLLRVPLV